MANPRENCTGNRAFITFFTKRKGFCYQFLAWGAHSRKSLRLAFSPSSFLNHNSLRMSASATWHRWPAHRDLNLTPPARSFPTSPSRDTPPPSTNHTAFIACEFVAAKQVVVWVGGLVLCRNKMIQRTNPPVFVSCLLFVVLPTFCRLATSPFLSSCLLFVACFCSHPPPPPTFPFPFPAMPGRNKGFASKPGQKKIRVGWCKIRATAARADWHLHGL
jgi:hypothetical protein